MQQVHPSLGSPAAVSAVFADRQLELLYQELLHQNRRAATPFSHPLSGMGVLYKLREHIQDLSRLADAAILNAESVRGDFSSLTTDLRALLKTQESWTDRLENQIWRLESQAKWQQQLRAVMMESGPSENAVRDFCSRIAGETCSLPTGLLLLPEPGLSFAPARRIAGWSRHMARAIEACRLALFASVELASEENTTEFTPSQLVACMMVLSSDSGLCPADLSSDSTTRILEESVAEFFGKYLTVATPDGRTRLIRFCCDILKLMQVIENASLSSLERLLPPEIIDHYSRACHLQLLTSPPSGFKEPTVAGTHSARADLVALMRRFGLTAATPATDHNSQKPENFTIRLHSAGADGHCVSTITKRSELTSDHRPKLYIEEDRHVDEDIDDEPTRDKSGSPKNKVTETAETAELTQDC